MKKNISIRAKALFILLFVCSFSIFAQNNQERKQLFDYDWKFFLGDTYEAKVIRSNHRAGEIKLSVSSNGLEGKSIVIKSIKINI